MPLLVHLLSQLTMGRRTARVPTGCQCNISVHFFFHIGIKENDDVAGHSAAKHKSLFHMTSCMQFLAHVGPRG